MKQNRRTTGTMYERAAGKYLAEHGYTVLEYNYRCRLGEIDLIALDGEYLVFCEVKYRRAGHSLEAVNGRKQHRIFRCAQYYLMERHLEQAACRFDVVGIEGERVLLIKHAFFAPFY